MPNHVVVVRYIFFSFLTRCYRLINFLFFYNAIRDFLCYHCKERCYHRTKVMSRHPCMQSSRSCMYSWHLIQRSNHGPKGITSSMQSSMPCTNVVTRASSLLPQSVKECSYGSRMYQASLTLVFIVNIINIYISN